MTEKRNVGLAIVLSIITCGIYGIYWFIQITDETNSLCNTPADISGGMAFVLTLVTCGIYGYVWSYKIGQKIDNAYAEKGLPVNGRSLVYLLLTILGLGIVTYALAQSALNELA